MANTPRTIAVTVQLDVEAFQDAVGHAIQSAADMAAGTIKVAPEDVRVGDVLLVPVLVSDIRTPHVGGPPESAHIFTRPVVGSWAVNRAGQLWTHGWTITDKGTDSKLVKVVRS